MKPKLDYFGKNRRFEQVSVAVRDLTYSCRLYCLDVAFDSTSGPPETFGIDVACGATRTEVAMALRALADRIDPRDLDPMGRTTSGAIGMP